jgi:hypothetical protein
VKKCGTCHEIKPLDDFNRLRGAPDGRQPRCRDCCKAWYAANSTQHKANVARRNRQVLALYYSRVREYFATHPCVDCGETDIRVLEFDHRPDQVKLADVAQLISRRQPWSIVQAEILKCDVRCSNCHRRLTGARANSWRQLAYEEDIKRTRKLVRNRLQMLFPEASM